MRWTAAAALALTAAGCAGSAPSPTMFFGNSKVMNGPAGCRSTCELWGMDLAGMVKMGDYSDGCICQVRPAPPAGEPGAPAGAPVAPPSKEPAAPAGTPAAPSKKGGTSANDAAKAGSAMTVATGAVMVQLAQLLAEYKAPDPFQP